MGILASGRLAKRRQMSMLLCARGSSLLMIDQRREKRSGSPEELYNWSITIKPTLNWFGRWGPQEDSMLFVGAFLYGFGNWEAITEDSRLGLDGKFSLRKAKR
ncbi:hypothetical protein J3R83DRAFT_4161 [Lanmaoa asiatica]|nr:hypothetical protein J3R83DRAFT_4161 [Lanmaoa asiatica]